MKVLISSLDSSSSDCEVEISELNFEREKGNFWMRCVMGNDWLQRINSSATLGFSPRVVRFTDSVVFVVYETGGQAHEFESWLQHAQEQVREGYSTMRG